MAMTDREIVTQIIESGNTELFGAIVERYSGEVYAAALATARSREIAEEATQQAFVRAFERLEQWRGGFSIAPYLKMIAHNTALSLLEERKRHHGVAPDNISLADQEYSLAHEQTLQRLEEAIARLEPNDQLLVELFYWQHLSTREIAHQMGLSESNVLVRLHRIRNKLKQMIDYGE
ncbi:MAG: sigma-70 family RNA polymerase sigma factor [Tidjanibacter sp.]|nr:sigma-70 family RNA polymerase sigma factor [Tidjanibacter sp.]